MRGQRLAPVHGQVGVLVERDLVLATQLQPSALADARNLARHGFGVDLFGTFPGQPEQDGLITSMAMPGRAE